MAVSFFCHRLKDNLKRLGNHPAADVQQMLLAIFRTDTKFSTTSAIARNDVIFTMPLQLASNIECKEG